MFALLIFMVMKTVSRCHLHILDAITYAVARCLSVLIQSVFGLCNFTI